MIFLIAIGAGLITSLSPCVITALPFIVGSAMDKDKYAPIYISIGLVASFVFIGVTFALTSKIAGIDQDHLKTVSAVIFISLGIVLIVPYLSDKLSNIMQSVASRSSQYSDELNKNSFLGFLLMGILLGFIWSPCSGPTLGVAITMVAKEGEILMGSLIMLVYGISASIPLLVIAYISRGFVKQNRLRLNWIYTYGKYVMAGILIVYGVSTLTGWDRIFEAKLLELLPESWLQLITEV